MFNLSKKKEVPLTVEPIKELTQDDKMRQALNRLYDMKNMWDF